MTWRTPQEGDTRTVHRFAWLPVALSNGRTVWLERYQEWQVRDCWVSENGAGLRWFVRGRGQV